MLRRYVLTVLLERSKQTAMSLMGSSWREHLFADGYLLLGSCAQLLLKPKRAQPLTGKPMCICDVTPGNRALGSELL